MIQANVRNQAFWVRQTEHARAAAEIIKAWRLPQRTPKERTLLYEATLHHDDGWEALESMGEPAEGWEALSFLTLDSKLKTNIWLRGVELAEARHPYIGLLVAMHAHRLTEAHNDRTEADIERLRLLEQACAALRDRLSQCAEGEALLALAEHDCALLGLCDALQLMTIGGLPRASELIGDRSYTLTWRESSVAISPWPFVEEAIALRCATVDGPALDWALTPT